MSAINYSEKIPNNVDLGSDRTLQRALEQWQPNFINWWDDMGPEGTTDNEVYLRTAVSVDPQRIVAACTLASAVLLGIVDRLERQTGRRVARVLSDVALLTPVVPLVYLL